jgi:hypothetical protein
MQIQAVAVKIIESSADGSRQEAAADLLLGDTGVIIRGVRLLADFAAKLQLMTLPAGCEMVDPWAEHAFEALAFRAVAMFIRQNPDAVTASVPLEAAIASRWTN